MYTHLASERPESSRFLLLQHVGADALEQGSKIIDDEMGAIGGPVNHPLVGRRVEDDADVLGFRKHLGASIPRTAQRWHSPPEFRVKLLLEDNAHVFKDGFESASRIAREARGGRHAGVHLPGLRKVLSG